MQEKPSFWSVLIPSVRYNNHITWFDKVLYSEITALTNAKGFCFAENKYFEDVFQVSKSTVQRSIKNLENENLIKCDIIRNKKHQVLARNIYLVIDNTPPGVKNDTTPRVKNDTTPRVKNDTYNNIKEFNNTSFNNISNKQFKNPYYKPQRPDVNPDWLDEYLKENT